VICECYGLPGHFVPKAVDFKFFDGMPLVLQMAVTGLSSLKEMLAFGQIFPFKSSN